MALSWLNAARVKNCPAVGKRKGSGAGEKKEKMPVQSPSIMR